MKRLREIRKSRGYTQSEVADYLNVKQATYSRYESSANRMDPQTLKKLSELFDISIDYLVGNTDVPMTLEEVRFNKDLDRLSNEELIQQYDLTANGVPITKEEAKKLLEVIRALSK